MVTGEKIIGLVRKAGNHNLEIKYAAVRWGKEIFRYLFLVGLGFVMLYPVIFMLSSAFKSIVDVYDPTVIWVPKHYSTLSLTLAMDALGFWDSLLMTVKILVPSVILQLVSTLLTAYGFARFKFKERSILFGLLIFTIIVPVQTYIVPLYINFKSFNFFGIGSLVGLFTGVPLTVNLLNSTSIFHLTAAFGAGIRSGLYIFILRQFFRGMPQELEDAAMIDGCGPFSTFARIMIPNVIPAIVTMLVFSIVWYWNDYYQSSMFLQTNFPLSVSLTNLNSMLSVISKSFSNISGTQLWLLRDSVLSCGCLLCILPITLLYTFFQRFFTESSERTGIVG